MQIEYSSLEKLTDFFEHDKTSKIFLIHGANSFKQSGAAEIMEKIFGNRISYFNDFSTNPKIEDVEKGIGKYKEANSKNIIAIGGGTAIDLAKLIKGLAQSKNIRDSIIHNKVSDSNANLIAVPTTAGSGSEATPFAVVYVGGIKYSLENSSLLPEVVVLDSKLTYTLSPKQTAISGMDALTQAIESYWSVNSTEESKKYCKEAIKLIFKNLEQAVNSPNQQNRANMMAAANLAGKAIAITKTTACHAISYTMTSEFGVPHGLAVSLTLPQFLEFNSLVEKIDCNDSRGSLYVKKTIDEIVKMLGAHNIIEAKLAITSLMKKINLPTKLSDAGIKDLKKIMQGINSQRMKNNPRLVENNMLNELLSSIF